jgi:two-component system, NarL family, sensor histidine kinase UhpB
MLEIQDDGQGFELPARWIHLAREGHLGLIGARERTEAIGGRFEVLSSPGEGTLVRAVVPRNDSGVN